MAKSALVPGNLARLEFTLVMPGGRRIELKQDGVLTNERTDMDMNGNISTQIEGAMPEGEFSLAVTERGRGSGGRLRWRLSVDTSVAEVTMSRLADPPLTRRVPPPTPPITTTPPPPAPIPMPERGEEAREL